MQPREQVDTGVDVGSNETAPARRSAAPGRPGRLRGRCLAARFLVAFAALLALPLQAQAQTVVTLVNSSNQTAGQSSTALGNHWEIAQGFTTGSNTYGYTLTNIRAHFPTVANSRSLTVTLHKDAPTNAAIATLTNPTISVGDLTFTAPANTTLDASTTYYVLFHGENIFLRSTTSNNEDSNGLSDWSVEDVRYRRDDRTSGALTEVAVSTPIRVRGTVNGTDATLSDLELEDNTGTAITLTPTFVTGTTSYTASVVTSVSSITLTPTVNESNATVEYLNASDAAITDTDTTTDALDAPLVVGANTFKVKVTAENTTTTETYTVVVTRATDTTPPSPASAVVAASGTSVTVTFNEDLDIAVQILPAAVVAAFTLTADGGELDIQTIASNNPALVFTLVSGTTIKQNQTVTVSYDKTAAGTDALEDGAANEVASFTDFAVTNNSTVVPTNTPAEGKPTISGPAQVGRTLTAATAGITDDEGLTMVSYEYEWLAAGTVIGGATSATYTPTSSVQGDKIAVRVTFDDDEDNPEMLSSDETAPVVPDAVFCLGTAVWCSTLTVEHDTPDEEGEFAVGLATNIGTPPESFGSLVGATFTHLGTSYTVTQILASTDLVFATSPNLPDDGAGLTLHIQRISGTLALKLSDRDTYNVSSTFPTGTKLWYFHAAPGTGPANGDYRQDTDEGTRLAVSLFHENRAAEGTPTISGTAQVGETLTAGMGDIADDEGLTSTFPDDYTFQWLRVDADGMSNETPIGADAVTYTPVAADVGKKIKVRVNFTDDGGTGETLTSDAFPSSGTITAGTLPALSFASANITVNEDAGTVTLTVELDPASTGTVTVDYATSDQTAQAGVDYTAASGTLTFAASETSKTITVPILNDTDYDPSQRFRVTLSNASGATRPTSPWANVNITNDDAVPTASIANVTVGEGAGTLTLTLALDRLSNSDISYSAVTAGVGGTATVADDYVSFLQGGSKDFTVPAGAMSATFDITIVDDSVDEPDETIVIVWTKFPSHDATPASTTFTGTITDNDTGNNLATGTPTISGTAAVGETLMAAIGNIADTDGLPTTFPDDYTFQWLRRDGGTDSPITGATASTYTPVAADVGKKITVKVSFTDAGGAAEGPLTSDAYPSSGTIMLPAGVTVSKSALTVTEQDATGDTYTVVLNSRPTASVTVTVGGYTGSDVTPNPASLTFAPSVWNTVLTVTVTAEGDTNTVDETVSLTHSATSTDTDYSGITIASVTVTVDDNDNNDTPAEGKPTISGPAQVGRTLTAATADITDADGLTMVSYEYQWIASGTVIADATSSTYTPTSSEQGDKITVRVTFDDDEDNPETLTSDETAPVVPDAASCGGSAVWCSTLTVGYSTPDLYGAFVGLATNIRTPPESFGSLVGATFTHLGTSYTVTQIFAVERQLFLATSPNLPDDGAGLTLHIQRVSGTYALKLSDRGFYGIFPQFPAGTKVWYFSGVLAPGPANPPLLRDYSGVNGDYEQETDEGTLLTVSLFHENRDAEGTPTISGTAQVGQVLTADPSGIIDADGLTTATFTYQWLRVDADGVSNETPIGTNAATYTLAAADAGKKIKVKVSFTDDGGTAEGPLTSDAYPSQGTTNTSTLSTDATLSDLELLEDNTGTAITLTPSPFVSTTTSYTAMVGNSVDEITIFPKENDDNAPYEIQDSGGTALTDADSVEDEFQVTLSVGDNTIKVEVTAEDSSTQTYTVTVTRAAGTPTAGVTVSKSALTVTEEDTTGDSYTVVLDSRPTANVTITIGGQSGADVTAVPSPMTFTPMNWNTAQTVTVTAGNDTDTADDMVSLTHSATSTDTDYSGITIAGGTVTVTDNTNTPAEGKPTISGPAQVGETLTADPSGIIDADGLTTATFTYQWLRVDADGVSNETPIGTNAATYTLAAADAGKKIKVKVSFTDERAHPEAVTSEAYPSSGSIGDSTILSTDATLSDLELLEDNTGTAITLTPSPFVSTTTSYTAMVGNSVDEITIFPKENDDNAPYEIQDSGGTALTDADSVEDEFQVTLSVGDNTIKVEVTAEDGSTQTYTVTVTRAAGTPTAGVTVSKSALTVTEQDATGDTYTVVLDSRPTASVTVTVGGYTGSDVTPNPASLTWAPSVWNTTLTVTVTAEGDTNTVDETVSLTHSATSTDTDYSGITIASVTVTVSDNDTGNNLATGKPAISGTAQVGETLTAAIGNIADTDGLPTTFPDDYTLKWLRVDADGVSNETAIGDDAATYTPVAADVGKKVRVQVSFTDDESTREERTSDAYPSSGTIVPVPLPTLSFAPNEVTVDEDAGSATLTVELDPASTGTVTVDYATRDSSAKAGEDYTATSGTLTFAATETSKTFTVPITDDDVYENNESFQVDLSNPTGATVPVHPTATVTIDSEDAAPTVRFGASSYTAIEGVAGAVVTVLLDTAAAHAVTIPVTTTPQDGASSTDYSDVPGSVTFAAGETEQSFTVTATEDSFDETGESVQLGFGTLPSGIKLGSPATATVALLEDVSTWYVWFGASAYTATEGGSATISVHLNSPWKPERNEALTVPLFDPQHEGGASADDYSGLPESVTFQPGQTRTSFTVRVTEDSEDDDGESVLIGFRRLFPDDLEVGRYGPHKTTLRIADNDGEKAVTVSFAAANYTAAEGGATATVRLRLDAAPGRSVTIELTKTHRGATAADYSGLPGSVTFGASETEKSFTVTATDDSLDDDRESVAIGFGSLPSKVSAGSPSEAVVQLTDNDPAVSRLVVRFDAPAGALRDGVEEGGAYRLGVRLSGTPAQTLTIPLTYEYLGGATAADFSGLPANVTFGANATSAGVTIRPVDDFEEDPGEEIRVSFGTLPAGVSVGASGRSTIIPVIGNDDLPGLSVADASAREWPNPLPCLIFVVTMDRMDVDHEVRVDYATRSGTAVAGQDFTPISGTLVFLASESRRRTASKRLCEGARRCA